MARLRRVYLESLGCSKTLVDSEAALGFLLGKGFQHEGDPAAAELLLLNTCSFIEAAREQSIERILDLARLKGDTGAKLAVIGCLPQRYADELRAEIPEIDLLAGVGQQDRLAAALVALLGDAGEATGDGELTPAAPRISFAGFAERPLLTPPHLAYVKIGEGCSRHCSFCAIPGIRGRFQSRTPAAILAEVEALAARGVREINLISQDTGFYGRDQAGAGLLPLIEQLSRIEALTWIRVFYLHPTLVELPDLLALFALPRVVPYLDMPIQHASDRMLSLMRRGHAQERLHALLGGLRRERPDLTLRSTVLVGHPGETDADLALLLDFLAEQPFDHLGVFGYSSEEGTASPALGPAVPPEQIAERVEAVQLAQMTHSEEQARRWVGRRVTAVVEALAGRGDGLPRERSLDPLASAPFAGVRAALRTPREAYEVDGHLFLADDAELELGQWVEVEVIDNDVYDLLGRRPGGALP
jgi:ribosomal protein S12 methylthiotransferase